jgi:hypothetical protein
MASQAAPHSLFDERNPLRHAGILEVVLSFLEGDGLFVLSVSKSWQVIYAKLLALGNASCALKLPAATIFDKEPAHVHNVICTTRQAVFSSPARLRLAITSETGLESQGTAFPNHHRMQFDAGKFADVSTLLTARELGLPFSSLVVFGAAMSGNISKLDWLLTDQQCPMPGHIVARSEDIEMLRWLKQRGCPPTTQTLQNAAERPNNRALLQYLIDEGCTLNEHCISSAVKSNDFEQVKWLHAKGAPVGQYSTWDAAHRGRCDVLEWLHERGAEFNYMTMRSAAECGHIELCQWLREQGCEWESSACEFAAASGEVETLDWLLTHGCPCDTDLLVYHACIIPKNGNPAVFAYIEQRGLLPDEHALSETLCHVGCDDNLAAVQWLRSLGAPWPAALHNEMGEVWHGESLAWARANGCTAMLYGSTYSFDEGEFDSDEYSDSDDGFAYEDASTEDDAADDSVTDDS